MCVFVFINPLPRRSFIRGLHQLRHLSIDVPSPGWACLLLLPYPISRCFAFARLPAVQPLFSGHRNRLTTCPGISSNLSHSHSYSACLPVSFFGALLWFYDTGKNINSPFCSFCLYAVFSVFCLAKLARGKKWVAGHLSKDPLFWVFGIWIFGSGNSGHGMVLILVWVPHSND